MVSIQIALQDFKKSGHQIEQLGHQVDGKRFFLAHDSKTGWYFKTFDKGFAGRIQLILRSFFGFYRDTHLGRVTRQLGKEISNSQGDGDICQLFRTLKAHWHRNDAFPWEIDNCINCFARERFKEPDGKRHPFCGRGCAGEYKNKPRPIAHPQHSPVEREYIPGYSFGRLLRELTLYAQRGHIDFYEVNYKPLTSIFGNFYPCPVTLDIAGSRYTFKCSEAAFQAHKFAHKPQLIQQFVSLDGEGSFRQARQLKDQIRPDWMNVNEASMMAVLRAKFTNSDQLKLLLQVTGSAILVEHTARDKFWGDGGDGGGRNMLGEMLMKLRAELGGPQVDIAKINLRQIVAAFKA